MSARAARGLTLIEVLLAVAATALLAIGVIQIFRIADRVVRTGKQVSSLTSAAALLERQFRSDFAKITHDGFFFVRNGYANGGQDVPQEPGGAGFRPRRSDELLAFTSGRFTSGRDPLPGGRQAQASAARLYYGHGLQRTVNDAAPDYAPVDVANTNSAALRLGVPSVGGVINPNYYAADWLLMRHLTLLAPPSNVTQTSAIALSRDGLYQIAEQPAAIDIFRVIATARSNTTPPNPGSMFMLRAYQPPNFGSGAVDIATIDLPTVRNVILGGVFPTGGSYTLPLSFKPGVLITDQYIRDVQRLMASGLPTDSAAGVRMRVELAPPPAVIDQTNNAQLRQLQLGDWNMLSGSVLHARVTEFIVEWSFGLTYEDPLNPLGATRTVWHGLARPDDADVAPFGLGLTSTNSGRNVLPQYDSQAAATQATFQNVIPSTGQVYFDIRAQRFRTAYAMRTRPGDVLPTTAGQNLDARLIHPLPPAPLTSATNLDSCFGYIEPTYEPRTGRSVMTGSQTPEDFLFYDANRNGNYDADLGDLLRDPDTIPWPWPKFVRITVRLADLFDPTVESTFVFVLAVPKGPVGNGL